MLRPSLNLSLVILLVAALLAGCNADSTSNTIAPAGTGSTNAGGNTGGTGNGGSGNGGTGNGGSGNGGNNGGGNNGGGAPVDPILAKMPAGVPDAAKRSLDQRVLPAQSVWPFEDGTSRTSGTGRYFGGAVYWTDFIYDAYGAFAGPPSAQNVTTPNAGSLSYPRVALDAADFPGPDMSTDGYDAASDPYQGNGADIFTLAIARDPDASYWRVDWVTLADPNAPIIAFALDTDNDTNTGTSGQFSAGWADIPNIRTAGVDRIIFISSAGVFLRDIAADTLERIGDTSIDTNSQSFIAKISSADMALPDTAVTVYALSGLHNGSGGFFTNMLALGGLPFSPPVYNLGFRNYDDEPFANNFWMSNSQAQALAQGDISAFAFALNPDLLGTDEAEPERLEYSVRWYVSSLGPEQFGRAGIYTGLDAIIHQTAQNSDDISLYAGYYDKLQPYGLWLPDQYSTSEPQPTPMTLVLHSFTQNYMQYRATMPNFHRETCNDLRQSFCLTVLGRGVSGFYEFASGVDLWEAWRDVASRYELDPARTFTSGFSMGALGSQRLMIKYPDVFAAGVILAGAQSDEPGIADQNGNVPGCFGEIQLENLKWNGYYHAAGSLDQLIPITQQRDTVNRMRDLGYQYTFDHYLAEDHVAWVLKDGQYPAFAEATDWLIGASAGGDKAPLGNKLNPGEIIYRFTGNDQHPEFALGADGAWWIDDLKIADDNAAVQGYEPSLSQSGRSCTFTNNFSQTTISAKAGRIHAVSGALPERVISNVLGPAALPDGANPQLRPGQNSSARIQQTGPHIHEFQTWELGDAPAANGLLTLNLQNVASLTVDLNAAAIAPRTDKRIEVTTDSALALTLTGLADGTQLSAQNALYTVTGGVIKVNLTPEGGTPIAIEFP